jgi:2'-5' RNA ligase
MTEFELFGDVPAPAPRPRQSRAPAAARQSGKRHSWFFAIRPSTEDAARIDAFAQALHGALGLAGRRIGPERLHISLDEVGDDVDEAMVQAACRAADAVRLPAMTARLDAAVTFSGPSGPFVLLGAAGLDGVRELRTALGCALADHGFKPPRAFEPHMTLSYDPHNRVERTRIDPIEFRVAGFALIKSHLGQSRHEVVRTWTLG